MSPALAQGLIDGLWGSLAMGLSPAENRCPGSSRRSPFLHFVDTRTWFRKEMEYAVWA